MLPAFKIINENTKKELEIKQKNKTKEKIKPKIKNSSKSKNKFESKSKSKEKEESKDNSDFNFIVNPSESLIKEIKEFFKDGVHFQLITQVSISIEFVPEGSESQEAIKILVKNKGYKDEKENIWFAPYSRYFQILEEFSVLPEFKNPNKIHEIPEFILNANEKANFDKLDFKLNNEESTTIDYSQDSEFPKNVEMLPDKIKHKLYKFQKGGIEFGCNHHCRILIADEMGVGKTIQAIALAYLFKKEWPALIICPGSMKYTWKEEILKWTKVKKHQIQIINKGKEKLKDNICFFITSYDMMRHIHQTIKDKKFKFIILDESHMIKNINSDRSTHIIPIAAKAKRLLLLSGTPLLNKPMEGYTSLLSLRPDLFNDIVAYGRRYCDPQPTPFGIKWSGASNTKELHFLLQSYMIRRLKKDVLKYLPPKHRQRINIEVDKKIGKDLKLYINKKTRGESGIHSVMEAFILTAKSKIKGVLDYIVELLEDTNLKFIIFGIHHIMLNAITEKLEKEKVDYIRIDGDTPQNVRPELVRDFQEKKNVRVAVLSMKAASTGITLTKAHTVIFSELFWTPSIMKQAEDRAHRIGQESDFVDIRYLFGKNTLDENIYEKIEQKLIIVDTTLDDIKNKPFIEVEKNHVIKKLKNSTYSKTSKNLNEKSEGESEEEEEVINENKKEDNKGILKEYKDDEKESTSDVEEDEKSDEIEIDLDLLNSNEEPIRITEEEFFNNEGTTEITLKTKKNISRKKPKVNEYNIIHFPKRKGKGKKDFNFEYDNYFGKDKENDDKKEKSENKKEIKEEYYNDLIPIIF